MRSLLPAIPFLLLAGCSDRPTPVALPVTDKPVVEVSEPAEEVLRKIAAEQKLAEPWYVRLSVEWKGGPTIEVHLDRHAPGPDDVVHAAGDLKVVMARELLPYLRGCRIKLKEVEGGAALDVTFPNQDAHQREVAGKWLREEAAKRKGK